MPFPTNPQTVIAAAGRRLEEFARLQGVDLAPLAQSVGIDVAELSRSDLRINLDAFMRLFHLLEIVSGDDCIGLRYALHFRQGDSGAFGFAILHAPTLREGLRIYQTYQRMVADNAHFDMVEEKDDVTIRWRYTRLIDYPDQYTDFRAALLVKVIRGFLGPGWRPRAVALLRPRPRSTVLHRDYFGPGVSFQTASLNTLSIPASALDTPSGNDDPRLFEMMEAACRAALDAIDRSRDLRLQVTEQILALLPWGEANLPRVAASLAMGERSLQRRLGELDTNFETLVEETRRDLSDRLLGTSTPLSEISYLCGYSNASAYSRAARGWYGVSPQTMRQRLRGHTT
ncbi:AraC family transcriptional regulator [Aestuariivirga litoralis]|uniref:AraC family transcriptional regulator n=1 Tax=Aestuariivirga litoralis TaxID=2650924 RepID=UPI00137B629F|nr:AraC family transcriptional regulator [Aestuariivirga litoralis]